MPKIKYTTYYPVLLFDIALTSPAYKKGYKYMLEEIEYDQYFFKYKVKMKEFMSAHALTLVSPREMGKMRKASGVVIRNYSTPK